MDEPLPKFAKIICNEFPMEVIPLEILNHYAMNRNVFHERRDHTKYCGETKHNSEGGFEVPPPESVPSQITQWAVDELFEPNENEEWRNVYFGQV